MSPSDDGTKAKLTVSLKS